MGALQSKDELLYHQVSYGNIEGIRELRRQGAGLEWMDSEGKTPLIVACLSSDLLAVAKALIELGADVNAYRPGRFRGTPLHHAAKRGLEQTVHLLLSHGANPFIVNDDCHTALDLAREKGHCDVVRAIENHISLFSGWLREHYGPNFLEALVPQWMSRKIWAVVLPCDARNPANPQKFELAIYPDLLAAKPQTEISLWKSHIEEPKFNQTDPSVIIVDKSTKSRHKFSSANEGDKQQIQWFYTACLGLSQVNNNVPAAPAGPPVSIPPPTTTYAPATLTGTPMPNPEDVELALTINASYQTALVEGVPDVQPIAQIGNINSSSTIPSSQGAPPPIIVPSAPPVVEETFYDGPIRYPSVDSSSVDINLPTIGIRPENGEIKQGNSTSESYHKPGTSEVKVGNGSSSSTGTCVICLDALVEGACIPCGHMAGCMSCLREIEEKNWGCPVCRAKIDQIVKLYAV
ncbi:probable E3 ubiquitin-protein ligase XBOS34 isoform X2 [Typha latifolia]|uniref:probable E3 ubiquitin-protein ligase XBOS34 isoform X2 n=1 Tax=Typha latifolia TaxID=4733 RepID=UPI003C2BAF06